MAQNHVRVTVVNPDPEMLEVMSELLSVMGYVVNTYPDALPGIEQIISSRPDLLIVDLDLAPQREQMTGLQVIHSARSGAALRNTPIILCATDPVALAAAWPGVMERGDVHQLTKPFDVPSFVRVVEAALGITHGETDAEGAGRILAHDERTAQDG